MARLTTEVIGALVKELVDLVETEQSPSDSYAINRRIGEIVNGLGEHFGTPGDQ